VGKSHRLLHLVKKIRPYNHSPLFILFFLLSLILLCIAVHISTCTGMVFFVFV